MLSGVYNLATRFQLDVDASNGYSNTLKEVEVDTEEVFVQEEEVVSEEEESGKEKEERDLMKVVETVKGDLKRMEE